MEQRAGRQTNQGFVWRHGEKRYRHKRIARTGYPSGCWYIVVAPIGHADFTSPRWGWI